MTVIHGSITASVANYSTTQFYNFTVGNPKKGDMMVDLYHSYLRQSGSNQIGGSNIGKMLQLAMKNNIAVYENNAPLTASSLKNMDILWLADPFNILNSVYHPLVNDGFSEAKLSTSEVQTIQSFVNSGKALFVTSPGYLYEDNGAYNNYIGLNTSIFNSLLGNYGIYASDKPALANLPIQELQTANQSSAVGGVLQIDFKGSYLTLNQSAWALAGSGNHIGVGYYQDSDSLGRVVVSSSDTWMSNKALSTGYGSDTQDLEFSTQILNWLLNANHPVKLQQAVHEDTLYGSFTTPGTPDRLQLYRVSAGGRQSIPYKLSNGIYSFQYQLSDEARYSIIAETTTGMHKDYIGWYIVRDFTGPDWYILSNNENGSVYNNPPFIILQFSVEDQISSIDKSSLRTYLDDKSVRLATTFDSNNNGLTVTIPTGGLENNTYHYLTMTIQDTQGNPSSVVFQFGLGQIQQLNSSNATDRPSSSPKALFPMSYLVILPIIIVTSQIISKRRQ